MVYYTETYNKKKYCRRRHHVFINLNALPELVLYCPDTENVDGRTAFDGVMMGLMADIGKTGLLIEMLQIMPLQG